MSAPLSNAAAEHTLLGSCIETPEILDAIIDRVAPEDFADGRASAVFSAMCALTLNQELTPAALVEELRTAEQLEFVGGDNAIFWYIKQAAPKTEALHAAEIIIDLAVKREQANAARQVAVAIVNGHDPAEALAKLNNASTDTGGFAELGGVLQRVISGELKKLSPTLLQRTDGEFILYGAGRLNTIYAPPEAAKSWVLAQGVLQLAQIGQVSVYVDAEDGPETFVERLYALALGNDVSLETLSSWITGPERLIYYYQDLSGLSSKVRAQLVRLIQQRNAKLCVLDGLNAMLSAAGADENSSSDVARFISGRIAPLGAAGDAGIVTIDHVVKSVTAGTSTQSRMGARGSGHKIAAISGSALRVEVVTPGSAFAGGMYRIWCEKDRPGRLKVIRQGSGRLAAVMVTEPQIDEQGRETTRVILRAPSEVAEEAAEKRWDLICAESISKLLAAAGTPMGKTEIRDALKEKAEANGKKGWHTTTTSAAFAFLELHGYVSVEIDGRSNRLTHLVPYEAETGEIPATESKYWSNPF